MSWLRHAIIDLVVAVIIILYVVHGSGWMEVLLWIYTPLMVLLKIVALGAGSIAKLQESRKDVPALFFHVLYAGYVIVLGAGGHVLLAGLWAIIWALSAWEEHR